MMPGHPRVRNDAEGRRKADPSPDHHVKRNHQNGSDNHGDNEYPQHRTYIPEDRRNLGLRRRASSLAAPASWLSICFCTRGFV